jgi:hypothetical protein
VSAPRLAKRRKLRKPAKFTKTLRLKQLWARRNAGNLGRAWLRKEFFPPFANLSAMAPLPRSLEEVSHSEGVA